MKKRTFVILSASCFCVAGLIVLCVGWFLSGTGVTQADARSGGAALGGGSAAVGSVGGGGGAPQTGPAVVGSGQPGGGNMTCAKYCGPKVFVGGAFGTLMREMKGAQIPSGVGYWLHPMGMAVAKNEGFLPALLNQFGTKFYFYEADLDAWTDGSNPIQTNDPGCWGTWLAQAAKSPTEWKCAAMAPWAKSGDIASGACIPKYQRLFAKIRAWGCSQCWIFWAPPSEPPLAYQALKSRPWQRIFKETGATGAMVDHPAGRSDTLDVSFDFLKAAKSMGLATGWCFNGSDSAAATAAMVKRVKATVPIDVFGVDNFSSEGTGWGAVSAQLQAVLQNV